ncbi:MAG: polyphosphate polymerase domain-containing protein [Bacteroidetes bacterium]|nr:polyphosphate polymerase domain-containing protein [Bacteroidota bacterium]
MLQNHIKPIVSKYEKINLSEMDEVKLMNRVDTKFAFNFSQFKTILSGLNNSYRILEIDGTRMPFYESLYYDGENFKFYNDHYLGRQNRFKVRFRKYVDSNLSFLEVKHKIKGRTKKTRINADEISLNLNSEQLFFLQEILHSDIQLVPKLWNSFHRITLVSSDIKERLTLDFDLTFKWNDQEINLDNLVIAELKQEYVNKKSPFYVLMKSLVIRPYRISKYCLGSLEVHGIKNLRYNRFKEKLRRLRSINSKNREI